MVEFLGVDICRENPDSRNIPISGRKSRIMSMRYPTSKLFKNVSQDFRKSQNIRLVEKIELYQNLVEKVETNFSSEGEISIFYELLWSPNSIVSVNLANTED